MKVRVGAKYVFKPAGFDLFNPVHGGRLIPGMIVTVVNLPGAPKANTMGQCYVDTPGGEFGGMVSTASLTSLTVRGRRSA